MNLGYKFYANANANANPKKHNKGTPTSGNLEN